MKVHCHHGRQAWWAKTTTDAQAATGARQTACGSFFNIRATYGRQLQTQARRTFGDSGFPGLRCVPVCSCSGRHSLQTRVSSGSFWAKSRLQPGKTGRKRRRKGDYGGHCMAQQPSLRTLQCWSERYSAEKQQLELAGREGLLGSLPGYSSRQSRSFCAHQRHRRMRI